MTREFKNTDDGFPIDMATFIHNPTPQQVYSTLNMHPFAQLVGFKEVAYNR